MKLSFPTELSKEQLKTVYDISNECDILFDTARLLVQRGIDSVEKAKDFLSPGKQKFHNPLLLLGMKEAVDRIALAKARGENILVFGDYDADGVCASTVLYYSLIDYGVEPRVFVPEREDNYGLNVGTVKNLNAQNKIDLLITVDCGISDREKIEELKNLGIDVIVTDHHEPPSNIPDCVCVNPKIKGQAYPFDGLCGAGVAYKLAVALIGKKADDYLDFVALATVADSMDLIGENRDIVTEGIKLFNNPATLRQCFKYLLGENNRQVTAQTFMYSLAPKINAGGRMGDAKCSLGLFLEKNHERIYQVAVKLVEYNLARQVECDNIYREAREKILAKSLDERNIILVGSSKWKVGFVGIVAARLVEDFNRPVIVFAGQDGNYKGSARSVDGVNIYEALSAVKDTLITFGGHSQAAGVALEISKFDQLYDMLDGYLSEVIRRAPLESNILVDMEISEPINERLAKEIEMLEPFGVGNPRPLFATAVREVNSLPLKSGSPHYSFKTNVIEMLDFNGGNHVVTLSLPAKKYLIFEVNLSSYKNRQSIKGYLRNIVVDDEDVQPLKPYIFYYRLRDILFDFAPKPEWLSNERVERVALSEFLDEVSTDREDFISVFNRLKELNGRTFLNTPNFVRKHFETAEIYQAILVTEVFLELGIFSVNGGYFYYQEKIKNALTNSQVYSKINLLKNSVD